jgi:DNA polymerase-3 subunit gamma/tau
MSYQVLARKWRPQTFASLVGQETIVTALRNALTEGRIAQAYLFSGIRGVGKTTAARVLAKALNCEKGPAADPCDDCVPCRDIARGADMDVIEVDAATYSKVEQVRELTESLKYGPARDRYKVVVLDEIHRLSRQAFDALLKIVEEPPPHLVFIFATTEIEAVPATILSRCQEFHFRRVSGADVAGLLRRICAAEGIAASDAALRLLARAGEGSVRDAVALLDQLATFGSGRIEDEEAVRLLGGLDTALFARLLAAILAGDAAGVREVAARVEDEGWDPRHVYGQFLAFCRDALHLALGAEPAQVDLPAEEAAALAGCARAAGYENLLRLLQQLLTSEQTVRRSETGVLAVEIAWLRAAELPKLVRVEELLGGGAGGGGRTAGREKDPGREEGRRTAAGVGASTAGGKRQERPAARIPGAAAPEPDRTPTSAAARLPPAQPVLTAGEESRPSSNALEPSGDAAEPAYRLELFLQELHKRRPSLAAAFADHALAFEDGTLLVGVAPGDAVAAGALQRGNNRQILEEVLRTVWGSEARWRTVSAGGNGAAAAATDPSAAGAADVAGHPAVQAVLEMFNGRIERVEPPRREQ